MQHDAFRLRTEMSTISRLNVVLAGILLVFITACGGSLPSPSVAVTASATTVDGADTVTLTATVTNDQNSKGVTWSVSGGGTLSNETATSATYTAPAASASSQSVTITATSVAATSKSATVTLTIPAMMSISTGSLASGAVGSAYSQTLTVSGGIAPYTWTLVSGTLPACLTLTTTSGTTAITGTPTASCAGVSTLTFKVTDSGTPTPLTATTSALTLTINAAAAVTFGAANLPVGVINTAYTGSVSATGGAGALTYTISSGSLPAGLSMSTSGGISGKPTATGTASFTVKAADAYGDSATQNDSITITTPALTVTPATLGSGYVGLNYSAQLNATGGSGSGYTWVLANGTSLPAGLSLSSSGAITGKPTATGTTSFAAQVTDSASNTATGSFSITVSAGVSIGTGTTLPVGAVGSAYSQTLTATGGSGTGYTWTVTSGSALPAGLTLSTGGVLSGKPTAAGANSFGITVTDSVGNTASVTFSLTINNALSIGSIAPPVGYPGTAYPATTLTASGGSGTGYSFTWAAASGSTLPAGLSLSTGGVITGTPANSGASNVTSSVVVTVTDSAGNTATANFSFTIDATLAISTSAALPGGVAGVAYSQQLTATGGSGGYTWATNAAGISSLAGVGLTLSSSGLVSGATPSIGTATFAATVTDGSSHTATVTFSVTISNALTINATSLPAAYVSNPYSQTLTAAGGSGTGYTWSTTGTNNLSNYGLSLSSSGLLSGTPTTSGTVSFTAQVKDSAGNVATLAFTLQVYVAVTLPAPNPSSLPSATVNQSYTGSITATGGDGSGYTWTVSGLPSDGLNYSTSGGTLTVTGTPTATGTVSFEVSAGNSDGTTAGPITYTIQVNSGKTLASCTSNGSQNAILHGNYAFLLSGFDPKGNPYDEIGDFTANGSGTISNGNADVNGNAFSTTEQNFTFAGTYSAGDSASDNRGTTSWTNTNTSATGLPSTTTYCFTADTVTSGIAYSGRIIEADGSGFVLTGFFEIQNTANFNTASLDTGYAFGVQGFGGQEQSGNWNRDGIIGQVSLNGAGVVTGGQADSAEYSFSAGSTAYTSQISLTGGSYTMASSGRGTLTLNSSQGPVSFVVYTLGISSGNRLLMLGAGVGNDGGVFVGQAIQQTTSSYTNASLSGSSVFRLTGNDPQNSPFTDSVGVGQITFNGSGGMSLVNDENDGGTINPINTGSGTYTVSSTGYVQISGVGNHAPRFYLYAPGSGFGLNGDTSVSAFYLVAQTVPSGGFTSASLAGSFAFGTVLPAAYNSAGTDQYPGIEDGAVTFSSGTVTGTNDNVTAPGLASQVEVGHSISNTYALDSTYGATTGRFVIYNSGVQNVVGYMVSPTQVFLIQDQAGQDGLAVEADGQP